MPYFLGRGRKARRAYGFDEIARAEEADIIINTSALGMGRFIGKSPLPIEYLRKEHIVFDAVYKPRETQFIKDAKAVGASKVTKMTLGGQEAYLVSYSATSAIQRDMYYVINDGKLYQIVVDYFKEEADMYKNILTKSAKSIKF